MYENLSPLSAFHLTGVRPSHDSAEIATLGLRPALFSAYQDLPKLRYDFPLVLVAGDADGGYVRSLSDIIDEVLREIAPRGSGGERLRKHVLGLEREIRTLASRGDKGGLSQLWRMAATNLVSRADDAGRESLRDSLKAADAARRLDGDLIDCDAEMPARFLTHAWRAVEEVKACEFRDQVDELVRRLSDILRADAMKSEQARGAEALKRSVGPAHEAVFDFEAMSGILGTGSSDDALPEVRRRRIRATLSKLESQRFFGLGKGPADKDLHEFVFDRCTQALAAFRERLPEIVEIIKAIFIAELEIENRFRESTHDAFLRRFDEGFLEPDDLALFPSYLVCLRDRLDDPAEKAGLNEALSSGLPIKVLVQNDDILEEMSLAAGQLSFGIKGSQLAAMALGVNNAYVLQSSGSALYQSRESILSGLAGNRPALFNVFSGLAGNPSGPAKNAPDIPPYLRAAAAMESRAFPAFAYDPAAGNDWASRFSIDGNPQAEADWPMHRFCYEDEELQRLTEDIAFTFVDFAASDARYAGRFVGVPRAQWHDGMVPVNQFLEFDNGAAAGKVPYILMIDEGKFLHRAVVEHNLIHAARRCREMWRILRELGGFNGSHAGEPAALQPRSEPEAEAPEPSTADQMAPAEIAEAAEPPGDAPYIDTARCTTCNECTEINNRMFVYDDNQQAYIADPDAGTYRQLVEAAECCQVAIIHPGRPRNPNEPDLDELISRAEAFR